MDASQGTDQFRHADALFRAGRFDEALALLVQLNQAWPGQTNIMLPMALCLEKLGRPAEALNVARHILANGEHPRARQLVNHLLANTPTQPPAIPTGEPDYLRASDILDDYASPRRAPVPQSSFSLDGRVIAIVVGVLVVIGLLALPMMMGADGGNVAPPDPSGAVAATEPGWTAAIIIFAALFFGGIGVAYAALSLMGKLLHNEPVPDLVDITIVSIIAMLVSIIPFVGWIIALVYIAKHYELSFVELLLYMLLQIAIGGVIFAGLFFLLIPLL